MSTILIGIGVAVLVAIYVGGVFLIARTIVALLRRMD